MKQKEINTKKAPAALGAFSQAVQAGSFVFTSGQLPVNPKTGQLIDGGVEEQAAQCMSNLKAVLKKANSSFEQVIKTTIYIQNMENYAAVNGVYEECFHEPYPAQSCVETSRLPKDVLCEIEAIALRK